MVKWVPMKTNSRGYSFKEERYKNMALILVDAGKTEEAKKAIEEARAENPEDTSLILTQAIYICKRRIMRLIKTDK
jgi:uncharacterized phage protein gp47/JayE